MKYYVMPANEIGERSVIKSPDYPANMAGVIEVELPAGDYFRIKNKPEGKMYPAYKCAMAIAAKQITTEDII